MGWTTVGVVTWSFTIFIDLGFSLLLPGVNSGGSNVRVKASIAKAVKVFFSGEGAAEGLDKRRPKIPEETQSGGSFVVAMKAKSDT
jgi:hypothetical protein